MANRELTPRECRPPIRTLETKTLCDRCPHPCGPSPSAIRSVLGRVLSGRDLTSSPAWLLDQGACPGGRGPDHRERPSCGSRRGDRLCPGRRSRWRGGVVAIMMRRSPLLRMVAIGGVAYLGSKAGANRTTRVRSPKRNSTWKSADSGLTRDQVGEFASLALDRSISFHAASTPSKPPISVPFPGSRSL